MHSVKILLKNFFSPCYTLYNHFNLFYWLYYLREKIELSTLAVKYNSSWLTTLQFTNGNISEKK